MPPFTVGARSRTGVPRQASAYMLECGLENPWIGFLLTGTLSEGRVAGSVAASSSLICRVTITHLVGPMSDQAP